jgi:cell division protein ZapA (FtsZ GTPase activity inhibitor)
MSPHDELITFVILGQEFRLRGDEAGRKRIERVAESLCERIRGHKDRGAVGDLRAAIMAAFELAFEFDELTAGIEGEAKSRDALSHAGDAMDRLLAKLSAELDGPQLDFVSEVSPTSAAASRRRK